MNITQKRKTEILVALGERFTKYLSAKDLVDFFNGQITSDELNSCAAIASGDEGAFSDILNEGLMELFKPCLGEIIAQDIGAEKVTIVWTKTKPRT